MENGAYLPRIYRKYDHEDIRLSTSALGTVDHMRTLKRLHTAKDMFTLRHLPY